MVRLDAEDNLRILTKTLNEQGKGIPTQLDAIEDFPYHNFSDLLDDVKSGEARILRFAYVMDSSITSIFALPHDNFISNLGLFIGYGGILASLVCSFLFSWWLLLFIPVAFVIGTNLTKKKYNSVVFNGAVSSEIAFCFLYFSGQISVDIPKHDEHYFYKREQ
jgi:hypothetical protein